MYGILELNMNKYFHLLDGRIIAFETPEEAQNYANAFYQWAIPQAMMRAPQAVFNVMNSHSQVREIPPNVNYVLARDL